MSEIRTWRMPAEPDREVRVVQDDDGDLFVRKSYSHLDEQTGLRFDGWHPVIRRDPDSPTGKLEVSEQSYLWEDLLRWCGELVDMTGIAVLDTLPN